MIAAQILTWAFSGVGLLVAGTITNKLYGKTFVGQLLVGLGTAAVVACGLASFVVLISGK